MGVGDLFNNTADFTTLTDNRGIRFDDAVHKAKIQLDEEGISILLLLLFYLLVDSEFAFCFNVLKSWLGGK